METLLNKFDKGQGHLPELREQAQQLFEELSNLLQDRVYQNAIVSIKHYVETNEEPKTSLSQIGR